MIQYPEDRISLGFLGGGGDGGGGGWERWGRWGDGGWGRWGLGEGGMGEAGGEGGWGRKGWGGGRGLLIFLGFFCAAILEIGVKQYLVSKASPLWGDASYCRSWLYVLCIYMYRMFITRECTEDIMDSTKGNGRLGNPAIDTLVSSMMKKMAADFKTKGKNLDLHVTCLVSSCQGKDAGVLFRLHFSIHQQADIGCDTSSW